MIFFVNVGVEMAEKIDSVDSVSSYTTPQIGVNNSIFFFAVHNRGSNINHQHVKGQKSN